MGRGWNEILDKHAARRMHTGGTEDTDIREGVMGSTGGDGIGEE